MPVERDLVDHAGPNPVLFDRVAAALRLRRRQPTPAETVRRLMRAGKVKQRCCRSNPRCRRCPVIALERARAAQAERVTK